MNFEEEKRLRKQGFKKIAGVDEAGRGCERPDAEVLTNNGWKPYSDINTRVDKVLSYTNEGYIEWQRIEKVIEKDFEGNLIELRNRGINMVVTPDHYFTVIRRVFKRDRKDNNRLKLVGYKTRKERRMVTKLSDNDFIPRGGKWRGTSRKFFVLPRVERDEEKLIDMKQWVAFFGIYLAEGSVSQESKKGSYKIFISQRRNVHPDEYEKIYKLLKKLLFKFSKFENGFKCYNKQLYTYLRRFGDCYNKFIAEDIKELPPYLLNVLVEWMILGDGSCYTGKSRKEVCVYYTASKRLKDDFEEVLLKAGWTYHTSVRRRGDRYIGKRLIKRENQHPAFEIRLRRNNKAIIKHLRKGKVFYKGKVFCIQLPEFHNFYVRRDGTGYFTGNSLAGPVVAATVAIDKKCFNNRTVKRWDNLGVNDSKKLTAKKREEIFEALVNSFLIEWGIGRVGHKVIDRINILEATKLAMERAVRDLEKKASKVDFLILDGNMKINLDIAQKSIVRADKKVFSCAAASIIAKVTRDKAMKNYDKKYPGYGLLKHKGYPTKHHCEMLKKYGPCKIHRRTFGPVKNY